MTDRRGFLGAVGVFLAGLVAGCARKKPTPITFGKVAELPEAEDGLVSLWRDEKAGTITEVRRLDGVLFKRETTFGTQPASLAPDMRLRYWRPESEAWKATPDVSRG